MDDFDEWAFHQCVTLGCQINGIKNEDGENIAWINTSTEEVFDLPPERQQPTGDKISLAQCHERSRNKDKRIAELEAEIKGMHEAAAGEDI
jgi:hypothetical protein